MQAREKQSLAETISRLPEARNYAATLIARIKEVAGQFRGRRLLEVGAAAGCLTIALDEMGYICTGLEPDANALRIAHELARQLNRPCLIIGGRAEQMQFPAKSFDLVRKYLKPSPLKRGRFLF
jgi:ubiquinone/menaquinone biosynthesis C-methylase UbiE